jgi:glycine oxidase
VRATPLAGPTSIRPCSFTPSPLPRSADVVIVGAGIIGLSIAWRALEVGKSVAIIDPRPASGASFVAGGMLGATAEVTFAEAGRVDRLRTARAEWDPFLDDLSRDQGRALPYVSTNTVVAGVHRSDQLEIDHLVKFQRSLNLRVEPLGKNELDALTPGLGLSLIHISEPTRQP